MHKMTRAAFLFVLFFATPATAQELWNKAEYGMTVKQVMHAVPGSKPVKDGGTLKDGAVELLRLTGIEISQQQFDAEFFFKNDRLVQVTLSCTNPKKFILMTSVFDSILTTLRSKYGTELNSSSQQGIANIQDATFVSGGKNITLVIIGIGDNPVILSIVYQVRIAKEAEKL